MPGRGSSGPPWAVARARRLEWVTFGARLSIVAVLGVAVSTAEAVEALWFKNLLALAPPLIFLVAGRLEARPPGPRFPYGLYRAPVLAYLVNALALVVLAAFLLARAGFGLAGGSGPSLAVIAAGAPWRWDGWFLIAALVYAATPPLLLGAHRRALALALHDKSLYADSVMGRAEWQSSAAAIVGLLLVGTGYWWGDYAATAVIALLILRYGVVNAMRAAADLMGQAPRRLAGGADDIAERVLRRLQALPWVGSAQVRLREHGRLIAGEAMVTVTDDRNVATRTAAAQRAIRAMDWRLATVVVVPQPPYDTALRKSEFG